VSRFEGLLRDAGKQRALKDLVNEKKTRGETEQIKGLPKAKKRLDNSPKGVIDVVHGIANLARLIKQEVKGETRRTAHLRKVFQMHSGP